MGKTWGTGERDDGIMIIMDGGLGMRILLGFLGSCLLIAMLANALMVAALIIRAIAVDKAQRYAETHNKRRRI